MTRTGRLAAAGLAAASLALAVGPAAQAVTHSGLGVVSVQSNPAAPGRAVWVWDGDQCAGTTGTATSKAFAAPAKLAPLDNMLGGSTKVAWVRPGDYSVTVTCSGKTFKGWVVVAPKGAPHTGDGASILSSGGGANLAEGAALAAAGLGLGAFALRRRRAAQGG
jgi:hypothetical protein